MDIDRELVPFYLDVTTIDRVWGKETIYATSRAPNASVVSMAVDNDYSHIVGKTLADLCQEYGRALVGDACIEPSRFPLIAKVLEATKPLSIQVHPSAGNKNNDDPKTEMWMSIGNSSALVGLKQGTSNMKELIGHHIDAPISSFLNNYMLHDKDMVLIEAGQIHALVGGKVFEISQCSDTTYRLYDWDRLGLDGKPRALQIDKSLDAIDCSLAAPTIEKTTINCDFFKCQLRMEDKIELTTNKDTFTLVYFINSMKCMVVPANIGNSRLTIPGNALLVTLV